MAIELKPDFAEAYASRALANFKLGKTDIAIQDFNYSIELNPEFGWAYCKRGEVWLQLENWGKARKDLTIARTYEVDIIESFHYEFESISYFEQIFDTCLPNDIKAMVTHR